LQTKIRIISSLFDSSSKGVMVVEEKSATGRLVARKMKLKRLVRGRTNGCAIYQDSA